MRKYRNLIKKHNVTHFHDDMIAEGNSDIEILAFPFDNIFGDFRLFNGLPLEVMDDFLTRIREVMVDIAQAHQIYKNYYKTNQPEWRESE